MMTVIESEEDHGWNWLRKMDWIVSEGGWDGRVSVSMYKFLMSFRRRHTPICRFDGGNWEYRQILKKSKV